MSDTIQPTVPLKIERLPAVQARTGLGRSAIYAAIARNEFVQPVKLGVRAMGFISAEVDAWIAARAAARGERKPSES